MGLAKEVFGKLGLIKSGLVSSAAASVMDFLLRLDIRLPEYVEGTEGGRMYLLQGDRVSFWIALTGTWEPRETGLVRRTVKPGDVAVDIGAHIGYHTLILSKLVGENGRVYAFEPCAENFNLLKRNVEANACKNVVIEQKAVSSRTGVAKMRGWAMEGSASPVTTDGKSCYEVDVVRLDDYLKSGSVDFIKIDIEGHEYEALKGSEEVLSRSESVRMITEFFPRLLRENGVAPEDYLRFLADRGFKLYEISPDEEPLRPLNDIEAFLKAYQGTEGIADLFCVKDSG